MQSFRTRALALAIVLSTALSAGAPLAWGQATPPPDRPNIVLFVGDDLGTYDIGPYGNTVVRTPYLDRLAGESMLFTRAFAASPTCSPSRSALYTGLMPFRNGAHANHAGVKEGTRSLAHYLEPLGYRVAIAGKLHVGPEEVFPFERVQNSNVREPGYEDAHFLFIDLNLEAVDEWLASVPENQPFALVVADHSPHVIWPEQAEYDPADVDVPSTHIDTPEYRRSRTRYYTDVTKMDRNVGRVLELLEQYGLDDETIFLFTADQGPQWPFAKWSLYDAGVQAPLIVRWPGRVTPGASTGALVSLVDIVPTLVEAAGGSAPKGIDGMSFMDVLSGRKDEHRDAVFASHTGDGAVNRSPARMLRTERYKYILNLAPEMLYTTHMDRAKDHDGGREYWSSWRARSFYDERAAVTLWRYHNRPEEELYDLEADPDERNNLAGDPEYSGMMDDFRTRLAAWRAAQGDSEMGPEDLEANGRKRGGPPYAFGI